jgi:hypothetical protein
MRHVAQRRREQRQHPAIVEADVARLTKHAVHGAVEATARRLAARGQRC